MPVPKRVIKAIIAREHMNYDGVVVGAAEVPAKEPTGVVTLVVYDSPASDFGSSRGEVRKQRRWVVSADGRNLASGILDTWTEDA